MVQLRDLEREVEAQRGVYERFLRAREHGFDENRDPPNARIITPASPPLAPSAPKTLAIVFIALAAGLSFSVGAALLRDYFVSHAPARRERDPDPDGHGPGLDGDAPLPVIVETPRIAGAPSGMSSLKRWMSSKADAEAADAERGQRDPLRESADHPDSLFGQAIETLRAELTRGRPSRRARHPLKVLLNSEKSGAGKTTIAINLAWSAARAGLRTLVMEANPDSPALGALVGEDASLGLLELDGELRSIHRIDEELHLWVLLIDEEEGEAPRDLTERARAARFSGLSGNFDLVIIDGPSIEADETARLLASAADKIVLVTGPGESPPGVDYLVEALDVPQSKLSGAVLANSKPGRAA
jgi:succinoglycan biosynthesis transport protein ExoP